LIKLVGSFALDEALEIAVCKLELADVTPSENALNTELTVIPEVAELTGSAMVIPLRKY
jgi:hypothetical protein